MVLVLPWATTIVISGLGMREIDLEEEEEEEEEEDDDDDYNYLAFHNTYS